MKLITVDIQGFTIDNQFSPKEIAIYDGTRIAHYIFKSPKMFNALTQDEKKQVKYLEWNHHCIKYNSGHLDYDSNNIRQQLLDICESGQIRIYVKGHQKKRFLQEVVLQESSLQSSVVDMEIVSPPTTFNFTKGLPCCFGHNNQRNKPCVCALKNCYDLYAFICSVIPF